MEFPHDIWNTIFSHLAASDLLSLRFTSKKLRSLIHQERAWAHFKDGLNALFVYRMYYQTMPTWRFFVMLRETKIVESEKMTALFLNFMVPVRDGATGKGSLFIKGRYSLALNTRNADYYISLTDDRVPMYIETSYDTYKSKGMLSVFVRFCKGDVIGHWLKHSCLNRKSIDIESLIK